MGSLSAGCLYIDGPLLIQFFLVRITRISHNPSNRSPLFKRESSLDTVTVCHHEYLASAVRCHD